MHWPHASSGLGAGVLLHCLAAYLASVIGTEEAEVLPADRVPTPAPTHLKQQLSQPRSAARTALVQQPRAGAWLHAPPAEALGLHIAPTLFRIFVLLRLRLPVGEKDSACPFRDAVNDSFEDHARSCPCGGDRAKRHNRLRSVLAARAQAAGLHPEV